MGSFSKFDISLVREWAMFRGWAFTRNVTVTTLAKTSFCFAYAGLAEVAISFFHWDILEEKNNLANTHACTFNRQPSVQFSQFSFYCSFPVNFAFIYLWFLGYSVNGCREYSQPRLLENLSDFCFVWRLRKTKLVDNTTSTAVTHSSACYTPASYILKLFFFIIGIFSLEQVGFSPSLFSIHVFNQSVNLPNIFRFTVARLQLCPPHFWMSCQTIALGAITACWGAWRSVKCFQQKKQKWLWSK